MLPFRSVIQAFLCGSYTRYQSATTQMLLFAAVIILYYLEAEQTESHLLPLPNLFDCWLLRPVGTCTAGIHFATSNLLDQIKWDLYS